MLTQLRALVRNDIRLYLRDRRAVIMSFAAPIVIGSFFGYIFGGNGNGGNPQRSPILVAVADEDGGFISRGITSALSSEKSLKVNLTTPAAVREAVQKGAAGVGIVIPAAFGELLRTPTKPDIEFIYDPSRAIERGIVEGMLTGAVMKTVIGQATGRTAGSLSLPYTVREQAMTAKKGVEYNGYAHSFAGMSIQFILFMGVDMGIGLLLYQQRGLWKRLRAAPLSRGVLLTSRALSTALIALLIVIVVFSFARLVFGVRIEGSLPGFLAISAAFALMTAAFGLMIAALGTTPEASRGLSVFLTILLVMLGGAWVPSFIFPRWLQKATLVIPTRWAMDGLDATTWRGLGWTAAVPPVGVLLGFALLFGVIALARFRWEEAA